MSTTLRVGEVIQKVKRRILNVDQYSIWMPSHFRGTRPMPPRWQQQSVPSSFQSYQELDVRQARKQGNHPVQVGQSSNQSHSELLHLSLVDEQPSRDGQMVVRH
jgi:hypothetical protein